MTGQAQKTDAEKMGVKKSLARVIDYKKTFESDHGRKVIADMIRCHNMMTSTLDIAKPNELVMAYNEGQRMVIGRILQITKQDPYKFQKILEEIDDAARREQRQYATTTTTTANPSAT